MKAIADRHGKSVAQILIRFQVQRNVVVIPKSVTPARIVSNIDVFDFVLTEDEMRSIESFNRNHRFVSLFANGKFVTGHKYYPFKLDF